MDPKHLDGQFCYVSNSSISDTVNSNIQGHLG